MMHYVLARHYFRNGLKPHARTRTMTFQKPKQFSFYEMPFVLKVAPLRSSLAASDCKQWQPLLKSAPPSDESQPHKLSKKKKDVHATISVSRNIIQIDLFARVLSNYKSEK